MTNEERIKRWRDVRQKDAAAVAHAEATDPGATAEALVGSSLLPSGDVLAMLVGALLRAERDTVAQRRSLYAAVEAGQMRGIDRASLPPETADAHRRQLRTIVRLVEADIRAGIDVFAEGYAPGGLAVAHARLASGHDRRVRQRHAERARQARRLASRHDIALVVELEPQEATELVVLRQRLSLIHGSAPARLSGGRPPWTRIILPLLVLQLQIIQAESRLALIWALFAPALLLTLISSLYFLAGSHFILDMDVPTFSLLGATTWIMFRQIIFRTSTGYSSSRSLINLEAVTPLAAALVQSLLYLLIYAVVYAILLTAGHQAGFITLPSSWFGFAFYVAMMGLGATSLGLIFGAIATAWPFFLRFAAVIERFLEIFSGVFFVSEQLPEEYRGYFLWSPFAHGMQLLRSVYFPGYKSHDASLAYFLISVVFLAAIALVVERQVRSNVQPM